MKTIIVYFYGEEWNGLICEWHQLFLHDRFRRAREASATPLIFGEFTIATSILSCACIPTLEGASRYGPIVRRYWHALEYLPPVFVLYLGTKILACPIMPLMPPVVVQLPLCIHISTLH